MLRSFIRGYLELPAKVRKLACLGGGVGTSQILKGLRTYDFDITAVVSMADDGGSSGRLRRAFSVPPSGDIVNCLAALSEEESVLKDLFLYRFAGAHNAKDTDLSGQKLGNLIFVALTDLYKGDVNRALAEFSKIISPRGRVLPATVGDVNIWALTKNGKKVFGERNIDLGKYNGGKSLTEVHLDPPNPKSYAPTIDAIKEATTVIVGPGDLFSTVLPVLIVPGIKTQLSKSTPYKIFIANIANKAFETPNFKVSDYLSAITHHLPKLNFDTILVNTNHTPKIPRSLDYKYVTYDSENLGKFRAKIVEGDFVNSIFPLYHDSDKIAEAINKLAK